MPYIGASLWEHNKIDDAYVLSHEKRKTGNFQEVMGGATPPFVCT